MAMKKIHVVTKHQTGLSVLIGLKSLVLDIHMLTTTKNAHMNANDHDEHNELNEQDEHVE